MQLIWLNFFVGPDLVLLAGPRIWIIRAQVIEIACNHEPINQDTIIRIYGGQIKVRTVLDRQLLPALGTYLRKTLIIIVPSIAPKCYSRSNFGRLVI